MERLAYDMLAQLRAAHRAGSEIKGIRPHGHGDDPSAKGGHSQVRMGVYAIQNTVDGAVYVGSTTDIDERWAQHRAALDRAFHHDTQLQAAWDRHGAAAFDFVILERVGDGDSLAQAEQRWIDRYSADDLRHVYNSQSRAIRKLHKLIALDEAAQRLGLRPAALRRWVEKGLVSCHHSAVNGSSGPGPDRLSFDSEEIGTARRRIRKLEGHRVAEIVATLHEHQERVRRWLRRGRYFRHRLDDAPDTAEELANGGNAG